MRWQQRTLHRPVRQMRESTSPNARPVSPLYIGDQAGPLPFRLSSGRGGYGSYGLFGKRDAYAQ